MCKHQLIQINDVTVCKICGLSFLPGGKVIFDRRLPGIINKQRRRKHRAKT